MTIYKEKPKVIHAIQYDGFSSFDKVEDFMGDDFRGVLYRPHSKKLSIGDFTAKVGDYIIKDFLHGYIVMSKDEFERLYEKEG